jgi:hypothetical protein
MTMHAMADIIWLIGAVLATLALDFLCRRFGNGRLRRHPGGPGPAGAGDRRGEIAQESRDQQTRTRSYSADTPERGR